LKLRSHGSTGAFVATNGGGAIVGEALAQCMGLERQLAILIRCSLLLSAVIGGCFPLLFRHGRSTESEGFRAPSWLCRCIFPALTAVAATVAAGSNAGCAGY
jgi:hypothetical protein